MKVFNINSLEEKLIKILKNTTVKQTIIHDIEYSNEKLLLQTPKGVFVDKPKRYSYNKRVFYKMTIAYNNYSNNTKKSMFIKKFQQLEKNIFTSMKRFFKKNYKFKFSINNNKFNTHAYLNLNLQMYKNEPILSVFDNTKTIHNINFIMPLSECVNIIYLKNIWIKNNIIGLNWLLLQTKVCLPFIKLHKCLIVEDNEKTSGTLNVNTSLYKKYIMMKKVGVIDKAIKIELIKHNLDYNTFIKIWNKKTIHSVKKTDYVVPKTSVHNTPLPNLFTPNMLSSVKLKKIKHRKRTKKAKLNNKTRKNDKHDKKRYRPPTSNQLSSLLKNLKKTKRD